jgi:hypothetical protein
MAALVVATLLVEKNTLADTYGLLAVIFFPWRQIRPQKYLFNVILLWLFV